MSPIRRHAGFLSLLIVSLVLLVGEMIVPGVMDIAVLVGPLYKYGLIPTSFQALLSIFLYQVGHAGFGHLFGNFFFIAPFALYLEPRLGTRKFLNLFFACGIGSALLHLQFSPMSGLIGSSGSDYGVVIAGLLYWANENRSLCWMAVVAAIVLTASQIMAGCISVILPDGVAHWGHVGGALSGMIWLALNQPPEQAEGNEEIANV